MAYSADFKSLEKRIGTLRKLFLPVHFSKTGTYTPEQLDKARAYRLLAHAEFEEFIEKRASEIATAAVALWASQRKHSRVVTHLVANQVGSPSGFPSDLGSGVTAKSIVSKCLGQYIHVVRNNHGVKIANVLSLLLPIGIDEAEIDPVWLATIDGFGAERGKAAHKAAVNYQIDPHSDFKVVSQIADGLKDIDGLMNALKRGLR
jgi:hypothetical protein